jgi:hypothetical protein
MIKNKDQFKINTILNDKNEEKTIKKIIKNRMLKVFLSKKNRSGQTRKPK